MCDTHVRKTKDREYTWVITQNLNLNSAQRAEQAEGNTLIFVKNQSSRL